MPSPSRVAAALIAAGAAGLAYSMWEAQAFRVRHVSIPVLEPGATPLTVLHLSDIHLMPDQLAKVEWLRGLASLMPDFVVTTGDNLSHPDSVPVLLDAMEPLFEFPGLFVFGSNDYFAPTMKNPAAYLWRSTSEHRRPQAPTLPVEDLRDGLKAGGWIDCNNARATIEVLGQTIDVVGVDDPHINRDRYVDVSGPAAADADLSLGITHAPYLRVLDAMAADDRSLILAGHTHGGQLCLPFVGTLVTNCDLDRARARGLSRHPLDDAIDASWLHVSAGIGTSPYAPVRFACRPEAVVLTLLPRTA